MQKAALVGLSGITFVVERAGRFRPLFFSVAESTM